MVRAGDLRHRVTILRRTKSYDSRGHEQESFTPLKKVWAEVKDLSGRELERARQLCAEATVQIKMRATDITATDKIQWGIRTFEVVSATQDVLNTERVCLCSEAR